MSHGPLPVAATAHLSSGVRLRYQQAGPADGALVVLLHAWGESGRSFDRLLRLLPRAVRAVAPDLRGHGGSDKPATGYSLAEVAADVLALLDALDRDAAVLLGSSSGGYVAQQVAATAPDRVRGLVLVGSPHSLHGRAPFADEVDALTDPVDASWVRTTLTWFPRHSEVPRWYLDQRVEDGVRIPAHVWRATLAGLTEAEPPTDGGRVTAPTLAVAGERDDLLPPGEQQRLVDAVPGAQLVVHDGTGHLVLWEQPHLVAADLTRFLDTLPGGR